MTKSSDFFVSYKKNLHGFFSFLATDQAVKTLFDSEVGRLRNNLHALQAANKHNTVSVDLPCFEIRLKRPVDCGVEADSFLSIGGVIKFNDSGVLVQSISVCVSVEPYELVEKNPCYATSRMEANRRHIIRRFHFDIDCQQTRYDRPISHIQYGGNIHDAQLGDAEYALISTIDLPRIPSLPLDVVQVTNFFLMQFDTHFLRSFNKPAWRGVVLENDKIWKEYYIDAMFNNIGKKKTFYEWSCEPISFI